MKALGPIWGRALSFYPPGPRPSYSSPMHSQRGDTGGSLIEYVAVLLLITVALASVLLLALPNPIASSIERAVCLVLDLGDCDPAPDELADEDYQPERCLQTRMTDVSGYQVEVIVTLGEKFSFITEEFSDGRTQLTLVDTAKLEASLGVGGGVNLTKAFQLGADVSVTGAMSFPNGSTWVFDSPEEAARLADDLRTRQKIDLTKSVSPIIGWGVDLIWGPDIPDPHITRAGIETSVSAQASAGLNIGNEKKKTGGSGSGSAGTGIDGWKVSPKLQLEGAVGVTAVVSESVNHRDGSVSTTYELGGTANIGADWVVGDWSPLDDGRTGVMTVTHNADGEITGLVLSQVAVEDGDSTVTTTELKVTTDEERAMVKDWMGLIVDDQVLPLTWDSMAPTELGAAPSPFEQWVFDNGRVSRVRYANEDNVHDLAASLKLGVSLGLGGTWGGESMTATDAEYLGAPSGDQREYVEYETCA